MARPPLRLDRYFFTKTLIEVNEEFKPEANEVHASDMAATLTLDFDIAKSEDDNRKYRLGLRIRELKSKMGPLPYSIEIHALGWFTVDEGFEHPEIDRLVQINGASMLFGAAREHVLSITGRGPFGPYQLPTIHLAAELPYD